jgi:hypothetical protein
MAGVESVRGFFRPAAHGVARLGDAIAIAANAAGTLVVPGLVVMVDFDVVARGVFNMPFPGVLLRMFKSKIWPQNLSRTGEPQASGSVM